MKRLSRRYPSPRPGAGGKLRRGGAEVPEGRRRGPGARARLGHAGGVPPARPQAASARGFVDGQIRAGDAAGWRRMPDTGAIGRKPAHLWCSETTRGRSRNAAKGSGRAGGGRRRGGGRPPVGTGFGRGRQVRRGRGGARLALQHPHHLRLRRVQPRQARLEHREAVGEELGLRRRGAELRELAGDLARLGAGRLLGRRTLPRRRAVHAGERPSIAASRASTAASAASFWAWSRVSCSAMAAKGCATLPSPRTARSAARPAATSPCVQCSVSSRTAKSSSAARGSRPHGAISASCASSGASRRRPSRSSRPSGRRAGSAARRSRRRGSPPAASEPRLQRVEPGAKPSSAARGSRARPASSASCASSGASRAKTVSVVASFWA